MSKRKQRREAGAGWLPDEGTSQSLEDVVVEGYGLELRSSVRIVAKPMSIFEISPSPSQPRRAFPSSVRQRLNGGMLDYEPQKLLRWWLEQAPDLDVMALLNESEDVPRPEESEPITSSLMALADLAASIRRDGLTNPITIARTRDGRHLIETGERRWLAFHLLNMAFKDEEWDKIPARIVEEFDLWRQATENSARDDLNAIGKARQLALLLMDLHGMDSFKPIHSFAHEQDFYAQVADGEVYRIPRGKGEMLINATGLQNDSMLRRYRAILRAPQEFWDYADDHNLSEGEIRSAAENGYTVPGGTLSQSKKPASSGASGKSMVDKTLQYYNPKRLEKLSSVERRYVHKRLTDLLAQIEDMGFD